MNDQLLAVYNTGQLGQSSHLSHPVPPRRHAFRQRFLYRRFYYRHMDTVDIKEVCVPNKATLTPLRCKHEVPSFLRLPTEIICRIIEYGVKTTILSYFVRRRGEYSLICTRIRDIINANPHWWTRIFIGEKSAGQDLNHTPLVPMDFLPSFVTSLQRVGLFPSLELDIEIELPRSNERFTVIHADLTSRLLQRFSGRIRRLSIHGENALLQCYIVHHITNIPFPCLRLFHHTCYKNPDLIHGQYPEGFDKVRTIFYYQGHPKMVPPPGAVATYMANQYPVLKDVKIVGVPVYWYRVSFPRAVSLRLGMQPRQWRMVPAHLRRIILGLPQHRTHTIHLKHVVDFATRNQFDDPILAMVRPKFSKLDELYIAVTCPHTFRVIWHALNPGDRIIYHLSIAWAGPQEKAADMEVALARDALQDGQFLREWVRHLTLDGIQCKLDRGWDGVSQYSPSHSSNYSSARVAAGSGKVRIPLLQYALSGHYDPSRTVFRDLTLLNVGRDVLRLLARADVAYYTDLRKKGGRSDFHLSTTGEHRVLLSALHSITIEGSALKAKDVWALVQTREKILDVVGLQHLTIFEIWGPVCADLKRLYGYDATVEV